MPHDQTPPSRPQRPTIFSILSPGARANLADTLREENTGAAFLLAGAVIALIWANSPWHQSYANVSELVVGPQVLHLNLTLGEWAQDGLLTIFFFVVGLELKREMVVGQLRRFSTAVVPVVAAVGGMAVPAGIYVAVNLLHPDGAMSGWAIPVATDIAFAVAVLGAFGKSLPTALRAFLLTLAVADDLLGIVVIAVFYAHGLNWFYLALALAAVVAFGLLVRRRHPPAVLFVAICVVAWYCMHASGVHASIAGVLLGFATPALPLAKQSPQERGVARAERYEHIWRPISAGLAVPIFALFAAGVRLTPAAVAEAVRDPAAQGVALGLVFGKPIGILLTTWLLVTLTKAALDQAVRWADLVAVGLVAGIGFTVSLLIGKLAFPPDSDHEHAIKAAVLAGSLAAAVIGAIMLKLRSRHHTVAELSEEAVDAGDIDLEANPEPDTWPDGD